MIFYGSKFQSIIIGDSVSYIGEGVFFYNDATTSITIGKNVTFIGKHAFWACYNLKALYCRAINPPALGEDIFYGVSDIPDIYVPKESYEAYCNATGWSEYKSQIYPYN